MCDGETEDIVHCIDGVIASQWCRVQSQQP